MRSFESLAQFQAVLGGTKKWDRTLEAIEQSPQVDAAVAYSVGDSLTWMKVTGKNPGFAGTAGIAGAAGVAGAAGAPGPGETAGAVRSFAPCPSGDAEFVLSEVLTASRRYLLVVYCQGGSGRLEWAPLDQLEAVSGYSDLTDRQFFAPPRQGKQHTPGEQQQAQLQTLELQPGNVVIFDIAEAARLRVGSDFTGVTLRVTVEGHSFHNK